MGTYRPNDDWCKLYLKNRCAFCASGSATAYWSPAAAGRHEVEVCRDCALDVLPVLIADAFPLHMLQGGHAIKAIASRMLARFWQAVAHRLRSGA